MEHSIAHDLLVIWFFGMVVSFFINMYNDDTSIAKGTFNVVMWPIAILILCVKGFAEHCKKTE